MKKTTFLLLLLVSINSAFSQYNFEQFISYQGSVGGSPNYFTIFDDALYYSSASSPSSSNFELWKSDGTQSGTNQFADINAGFAGSNPRDFFEFNGFLYFTADVFGITGRELYRTNGTTTELFKDFRLGAESGFDIGPNAHQFVIIDNLMYFFAREDENGYDLWKTDGTVSGTQKLVELNSFSLGVKNYVFELNGDLLFVMNDSNDAIIGSELYIYSVASNTVSLVKDISPSLDNGLNMIFLTKFDGKLFFSGYNGKLYVTDGTELGTYSIENDIPINYTNPGQLYVFNNELYFIATVGGVGVDLYKCTKNIQNEYIIELVYDFNINGNNNLVPFVDYLLTNQPPVFLEHNNELYFAAREQNAPNNGNNYQIYKTDGTTTQIAFSIDETLVGPANDPIYLLKSFDNNIFFTMRGLGMPQKQLWMANPADNSVTRLTDYYAANNQPQSFIEINPIVYNNALYFRGSTNSEGEELWKLSNQSLSTDDFENNNHISIYPNPTRDVLHMKLENDTDVIVELYDVLGKKVGHYTNQTQINVSSLNADIYFLKITTPTQNQTFKVIKN